MNINLNKSDRYIIMIFFIAAIPVTFSGYDYSKGFFEPVGDTIIYCVFTLFVSYIIVFKFFPYFFPKGKIVMLFICTVIFMAVMGLLEIAAYQWVEGHFVEFVKQYYRRPEVLFWGISSSTENSGILIGILLGKKFYDAQMDIQKREKEKKENELRLLKSQIDPHFLFNNLNTVDSLIDSNPAVAKVYLQKLSQLYRYLIRTKDDEVVLFEEEMDFAKNYIYLLEKRFGKSYKFEWENLAPTVDKMMPPGALQTVLENVVKHNAASASEPILTSIRIGKNDVVVSNNIVLKNHATQSTKTGLNNLKSRYQLLSDETVDIQEDGHFTVRLPLLKEVA